MLQNIYKSDKNVEEIVKLEIERFKELELERYRIVEKDKLCKEYNRKLNLLEDEFRQRLDNLHARELESMKSHDKMVTQLRS